MRAIFQSLYELLMCHIGIHPIRVPSEEGFASCGPPVAFGTQWLGLRSGVELAQQHFGANYENGKVSASSRRIETTA